MSGGPLRCPVCQFILPKDVLVCPNDGTVVGDPSEAIKPNPSRPSDPRSERTTDKGLTDEALNALLESAPKKDPEAERDTVRGITQEGVDALLAQAAGTMVTGYPPPRKLGESGDMPVPTRRVEVVPRVDVLPRPSAAEAEPTLLPLSRPPPDSDGGFGGVGVRAGEVAEASGPRRFVTLILVLLAVSAGGLYAYSAKTRPRGDDGLTREQRIAAMSRRLSSVESRINAAIGDHSANAFKHQEKALLMREALAGMPKDAELEALEVQLKALERTKF